MKSVYVKPNKIELEKNLIINLKNIGDKQRMVDLSYKKVIENINALKEYDEKHPFYQNNNENENSKNEESKLILNEKIKMKIN